MKDASNKPTGAALVLGGGIGGMQAALDLAESGIKVYLADQKPAIGGIMSMLDKTFPTNDCAMCTMAPRLVALGRHKDIEPVTLAELESLEGEPGRFEVTLRKRARFVDESRCTGCGLCVANCPTRSVVQPLEEKPVELDAPVRDRVDEILERHLSRRGPLMPILQEINAAFNYLPERVLQYVAQRSGFPLTHLLQLATFYSSFSVTPRGRHVISVCMGTTCYVRGSERLMEKLSESLEIRENETTPDMMYTLKSARCIGCCGLAPALMVGETVHGRLSVRDVPAILERCGKAA